MSQIAIVGFARTPLAPINGALREVGPEKLGTAALTAAFERSGAKAAALERVIVGSVLDAGRGPNLGRTLTLEAGFEEWDKGPYAFSVRAGGASGLEALAIAGQGLEGDALAAGVGQDSASLAPYLLPEARHGSRLGAGRLLDGAHKDAWDSSPEELPMPALAAVLLGPLGLDRAKFLEARTRSVERAKAAAGRGELVAVAATEDGKERSVEKDELAGEKAAAPGDEVYAATLADGAAAVVIGRAESHAGKPRIVAWARGAVESRHAPLAPVTALARLLEKTGRKGADLAVIEVDESLFVAPEKARRQLSLSEERVNPRGGAHAYGHAAGACGLRALVAAIAELEARGGGLAAVSYGSGGGAAVAVLIER